MTRSVIITDLMQGEGSEADEHLVKLNMKAAWLWEKVPLLVINSNPVEQSGQKKTEFTQLEISLDRQVNFIKQCFNTFQGELYAGNCELFTVPQELHPFA